MFLIRVILRKIPTPIPTQFTRNALGIVGTCSASTCKSGSEMVMKNPRIKQIIRGNKIFVFLVNVFPIPSPNGSIDIEEPTVKKLIPGINKIVQNKNNTSTPASSDTQETERIRTIIVIGKTDESDSFIDAKICAIFYYSYMDFLL